MEDGKDPGKKGGADFAEWYEPVKGRLDGLGCHRRKAALCRSALDQGGHPSMDDYTAQEPP